MNAFFAGVLTTSVLLAGFISLSGYQILSTEPFARSATARNDFVLATAETPVTTQAEEGRIYLASAAPITETAPPSALSAVAATASSNEDDAEAEADVRPGPPFAAATVQDEPPEAPEETTASLEEPEGQTIRPKTDPTVEAKTDAKTDVKTDASTGAWVASPAGAPQAKPDPRSAVKRAERAPKDPRYEQVLTRSKIATLRSELRLKPDQARYWPAVESALGEIGKAQVAQIKSGAKADPDSTSMISLYGAAQPLLTILTPDQKEKVRGLARSLGYSSIAQML